MSDPPPFILVPLDDGRHELRAFSDTSEEPIRLVLDAKDGRAFALAVADVLTALDAPGDPPSPITLTVGGRHVTVSGTDAGVKLTVDG